MIFTPEVYIMRIFDICRSAIKLLILIVVIAVTHSCMLLSSPEEQLKKTIEKEMGRVKLPYLIDEQTRWDSIDVEGMSVLYNYTLMHMVADSFDYSNFDSVMRVQLPLAIRRSVEMSYLKKMGATFIYTYNDPNGLELYKLEVTPEMYK